MSGGSWERDGHPWCDTISLTCRVGTLPLKTAEGASLEKPYTNWRVIVLCVRSLNPTLFLARYDILFWSLRAHQKLVTVWLILPKSTGDVHAAWAGGMMGIIGIKAAKVDALLG